MFWNIILIYLSKYQKEIFLEIKEKIINRSTEKVVAMKKLIIPIIIVTLIWYLYLYNSIGGLGGPCVCPKVTENTYQGPNWPILLPASGCGTCGLPFPPSQFFSQLLLILLPTIVILSGYGIYKGYQKYILKK